ncbi:uncharacterized protein (TIGR01777 family) [Nakamurella flavida]|nr:TIGR01777 family oxidoreductase [Nakamurella flavida]MDP9776412.1 uncharacterized protein (TIGR01777 family) [Nakamurella flavida]
MSGFLGTRLSTALTGRGDEVVHLVRRAPTAPHEVRWDPDAGDLPAGVLDGADAVVNLCGVGVGDHRWTDDYKKQILTSRVRPTTLLAAAAAGAGLPTLINASGSGYYGNRGDEIMTEESGQGTTFLAEVCGEWEGATAPAVDAGTRVVLLRTAPVVGQGGDLLTKLSLLTKLMLGGKLGDGRQYLPWISLTDQIAAILFLLDADGSTRGGASGADATRVAGAVNMAAPHPVTNAEFTRTLGSVLNRPTPWVVPGFALHLILGQFAEEILGGQRAVPEVLTRAGYAFAHPTLAAALRAETS